LFLHKYNSAYLSACTLTYVFISPSANHIPICLLLSIQQLSSVCVPANLLTYLSTHLPAHPSICSACFTIYPPTCLPACAQICLPNVYLTLPSHLPCLHAYQHLCLPNYLSLSLFTYPSTCLPVRLPVCLPIYLYPCLPILLSSHLVSTCLSAYLPFYVSICLAAHLPVRLPIYQSSCLSTYPSI